MGRFFILLPNKSPYVMKPIVTHRQQMEQTREQLQQAELAFRHQVT